MSRMPRHTFSVSVTKRKTLKSGTTHVHLMTTDRFHRPRHALERRFFAGFVNVMERYLKKRPHLHFAHARNHIRRVVYFPRTMDAWSKYMPGGFATHHVHNPDHKRLVSGEKIDFITRNLFRHSADAIGLRSRAYVMMWFIKKALAKQKRVRWLSIASGTGQATFDALRELGKPTTLQLVDIDEDALAFAKELFKQYELPDVTLHADYMNVTKTATYRKLLKKQKPHVVEAMGLVEYLDDATLKTLVKTTYQALEPGSVFIFTNMRTTHPHLEVHKRGLGWPGVIQRTTTDVKRLIEAADVPSASVTLLLPTDRVYAVYAITK